MGKVPGEFKRSDCGVQIGGGGGGGWDAGERKELLHTSD